MMRSGKRWLIGIAGGAVFLLVLGFMLFAAVAMREPVDSAAAADGIVVLTGTDSRIVEGGRLLKQGRAKRMLISGVNRQTSRTDLQRISGMDEASFQCCVDLGYEALDTIGNADETRHWVKDLNFRSVIVVTSSYHMPRSITELRLAMPDITLTAHSVQTKGARPDAWWLYARTTRVLIREYLKFLPAAARFTVARLMRPFEDARLAKALNLRPYRI
jgi:uncharacterized SAM-binding protein YcdF (DUF218 family)